jgi:hypothetical protein
MRECLGERCPSMDAVKKNMTLKFEQAVATHVAATLPQ